MKKSFEFPSGDWGDVILTLDATTGWPTSVGSHVFGYDGAGNITSDTWTYSGISYRKTFTYNASGLLTAESEWVKQ
jgi:hypothetical protein